MRDNKAKSDKRFSVYGVLRARPRMRSREVLYMFQGKFCKPLPVVKLGNIY